jgi:FixJ family two-component response regulator/DNA-directed RNA polymerase specialized sigma24 family protein
MTNVGEAVLQHVPYLRRHARLLTGSQEVGDEYVRICLEMVVEEPHHLANGDVKVQLFRAFHAAWRVVESAISEASPLDSVDFSERVEQGLSALSPLERRVLLLAVVEKFSHPEIARILDLDEAGIGELLAKARRDLHTRVSVSVLIIEDETLIAMELGRIMQDMGHTVVGFASREASALEQAEQTSPGLVLADIKLLDEDSGISAAQRILQRFDVPVVFVTAFSELLLTGGRLEPAFVVSKPFEEEALKVTVAHALSTYASPETARVHKERLLAKLSEITAQTARQAAWGRARP